MPTPLELVSEQFPNLRERVVGLFERDPIFRELCEDYQVCGEALAARAPTDDLRREYAALQLRLETELLRSLHEDAEPPLHRK